MKLQFSLSSKVFCRPGGGSLRGDCIGRCWGWRWLTAASHSTADSLGLLTKQHQWCWMLQCHTNAVPLKLKLDLSCQLGILWRKQLKPSKSLFSCENRAAVANSKVIITMGWDGSVGLKCCCRNFWGEIML